jgi:hypothetical protein
MSAPWKRISPALPQSGQIQAVQAKKHVTVFQRSSSAPGAGSPAVKNAFTACAKGTIGDGNRQSRNAKVQSCMKAAGVRTGRYHRKSRAKPNSPLFGHVYEYGAGAAG